MLVGARLGDGGERVCVCVSRPPRGRGAEGGTKQGDERREIFERERGPQVCGVGWKMRRKAGAPRMLLSLQEEGKRSLSVRTSRLEEEDE